MYHEREEHLFEDGCFECCKKNNQLADAKYWLMYLLEQFYSTDLLDINECERCLEELCLAVGLKVPSEKLNITREYHPLTKTFDIARWKEWNKQYLNQLAS